MKKLLSVTFGTLILTSCTVTIPMQTNLSEQTLLLAENRNIKVNYNLQSEVPDGYIQFVIVSKNGNESINNSSYKYAGATAFSGIWESYFSSKFNSYSEDMMDVKVVMKKLELRQNNATSVGETILTGNAQMNVQAVSEIYVKVVYNGSVYEKDINVSVSEYNETQTGSLGGYTYTSSAVNPTQQKSKLLESCLNRSVIEFENFLKSIMQNQ